MISSPGLRRDSRRSTRRRASFNHADCQMAAIASRREASVATRDVDDFEKTRIEVINP